MSGKHEQFNIGFLCTGLQVEQGKADKPALIAVTHTGARTVCTFGELNTLSNRFANVLKSLGFEKGDICFTFLPKSFEQIGAFLGALKTQVIAGTLFSNFGDEALLDRLGDSQAKGIVTKKSFLKRISRIRPKLPHLKYIILIDVDQHVSEDTLSFKRLIEEASGEFDVPLTPADCPSVLHYTSGSTGKPKGVVHQHGAVRSHRFTTQEILSLEENDTYWCTADPGWVTGTSYGIIGPLILGVTQVFYDGAYNAQQWMDLLKKEKITVWYTAPTALRMLMQEDPALFENLDLPDLRHIFSVGEPLNPEIIRWGRGVFKQDIYDTYFQTETGAIMVSNRPGLEVRPGSMGKPIGSIEAAIISETGEILGDGEQGCLCFKSGWPSMFRTYLNNEEVYMNKFKNDYYYSGDLAYRDKDGYYWFIGRNDDVINTAGHLISPFEIESALLELDEVAEAAIIAAPDPLLFEKVVAFVKMNPELASAKEVEPKDVELKIRIYTSNRVSSIATPQEIIFTDSIPKNKSGKIMRRVLKATYLGKDPGDISTMEE